MLGLDRDIDAIGFATKRLSGLRALLLSSQILLLCHRSSENMALTIPMVFFLIWEQARIRYLLKVAVFPSIMTDHLT